MKKILFDPQVPAHVRPIPQHIAMTILEAIHRYAETGAGLVKPLSGEIEGFLRFTVGNHRVFLKETDDGTRFIASTTAKTPTAEPPPFSPRRETRPAYRRRESRLPFPRRFARVASPGPLPWES